MLDSMEDELKALGERLALLLAAAPFPEDVKEAWATLIPEMSLQQIDRLVNIIEREVAGELAEELSGIRAQIQGISEKYESEDAKAALQATQELKKIEKEI